MTVKIKVIYNPNFQKHPQDFKVYQTNSDAQEEAKFTHILQLSSLNFQKSFFLFHNVESLFLKS